MSSTPPEGGWGVPTPPPGWGPAAPGPAPTTQPWPAAPGMPVYGAPPPGWRPPALQPGIIPLRPLGLGEILDGGVRAIRANPPVMFGLAAIVVTVAVVIGAVLEYWVSGLARDQLAGIQGRFGDELASSGALDQLSSSLSSTVSLPLVTILTTILTGLLIVSVSSSVLGEKVTISRVLRSVRVWWVLGFSLLGSLVSLLAVALVAVPTVWLGRQQHWGAMLAVGLLGALVLSVAAIWFQVRTLLVAPALMLEGKRFWPTVARAWRLTRGSFWRLLGIYLLIAILVGILSSLVQVPFNLVATVVTGNSFALSVPYLAVTSVGEAIALTLATTYQAATVALLYIDVRMRREGLDVDLAQAAAAAMP